MALLDMTNIPAHTISGVSDELLEWLHVQSWKRFVSEISNDFLSMLNEYQTPQPLTKPKPKWYSSKRVVGKNAIGDFMKTISKEAYLSKL